MEIWDLERGEGDIVLISVFPCIDTKDGRILPNYGILVLLNRRLAVFLSAFYSDIAEFRKFVRGEGGM